MTGLVFTPAPDGDPAAIGRYQAAIAKLRPACSRCGKNLVARELAGGACLDRTECTVRSIFAGGRMAGSPALDINGFRALRRHQAQSGLVSSTLTSTLTRRLSAVVAKGGHMAEKKETAREVAVAILKKRGGGPIKVTELSKLVVASGRTKLTGKTPEATVGAHIYTAAKKGVLFEKTGRGEVKLLPDAGAPAPAAAAAGGSGKRQRGGAAPKAGDGGKKTPRGGSRAKPKDAEAGAGAPAARSGRGRGGRPAPTDDVGAGDRAALEGASEAGGESLADDLLKGAGGAGAGEPEPAAVEEPEPAAVG